MVTGAAVVVLFSKKYMMDSTGIRLASMALSM
jgi:hypothetical protein